MTGFAHPPVLATYRLHWTKSVYHTRIWQIKKTRWSRNIHPHC